MKTFLTILVLFFSFQGLSQGRDGDIKVLSAVDGFFHFKVSPKLKGAMLEVYDESQRLISKQEINCRRMLIDFYDVEPGTYSIQITAGEFHKSFQYTLIEENEEVKLPNLSTQADLLTYERYGLLTRK